MARARWLPLSDMAALDVLLARDLIDHNPMPGQAPGIVGFKQWASAVRSSFPDVHGSVEIVLAEGDFVTGHVIWRGTPARLVHGSSAVRQAGRDLGRPGFSWAGAWRGWLLK
jgi:hypothetical protein